MAVSALLAKHVNRIILARLPWKRASDSAFFRHFAGEDRSL
jgi:hypothetical protein